MKCPSVALMFQIGDDATYHNVSFYMPSYFYLTLLFFVSFSFVARMKVEKVYCGSRWGDVKNQGTLVLTRLAKVMKLTLCTFLLEMLYPEGFTVATP